MLTTQKSFERLMEVEINKVYKMRNRSNDLKKRTEMVCNFFNVHAKKRIIVIGTTIIGTLVSVIMISGVPLSLRAICDVQSTRPS